MDVLDRTDLPFPQSLPEFQRLFPDDGACAAYLERARWGDGFACPHCGGVGEPFRIATRPGVLTCRACRRQTGLTVGTVMERSHTPLSTWFWAAYLVASQTPGMSAVQFQRQLGLTRYETAFGILHKLRAGIVRPDQDRIGASVNGNRKLRTFGNRKLRSFDVVSYPEIRCRGCRARWSCGEPGWRSDHQESGKTTRLSIAGGHRGHDALLLRRRSEPDCSRF